MKLEETIVVTQFFKDNKIVAEIENGKINKLKELVEEFKLDFIILGQEVVTICFDMGDLGSFEVCTAVSNDDFKFNYTPKSERIDVHVSSTDTYLFTDKDSEEPYNRKGGLYGFGSSWKGLELQKEKEDKRFFKSLSVNLYGSSYEIEGFTVNSYWNTVKFGVVISPENKEEFVTRLLQIINF